MITAVFLGLAIGLALGALGGGGSILAVPVLVHLAGQAAGAATATALVAVGAASAVGAISHAHAGHVRWRAAGCFVATGVPGSWAGAMINGRTNDDLLLLGFSALVLVAAHRMLTACPSCTNVGATRATAANRHDAAPAITAPDRIERRATTTATRTEPVVAARSRRPIARVAVAGSVVGFLTGLFGVGGGFVIVPALTLALGLSMPAAIGTSLVVIVGNAVVALGFRGLDAVDWQLALPFTATMLAGGLIGSLVGHRLPPTASLRAFAGLLVLVAIGNGIVAAIALRG